MRPQLFPLPLRTLLLAAGLTALLAPALQAQNQIVLGDSTQDFSFQATSSSALQLALANCVASACTIGSGSAYGEGVFASGGGQYTLTTDASNAIVLTVTSNDSGASFTLSQTTPINFTYTSSAGTLSGTLTLTSLDQGNNSTTANLSGELEITGGSMAQGLASAEGEASLILPVGGSLASALSTGGSVSAQVGYPSTITLAPGATEKCPICRDFITSGGWIIAPDGAKANFGVHGGIRNGAFWGHVEFNDHGSAPPMTMKSETITNYVVISSNTRQISGTAEVNGRSGYTFTITLTDADNGGEGPGPNHADTFAIQVSNGYSASGNLGGGDVEIHHGKCEKDLIQQTATELQDHAQFISEYGIL